MGEFITIGCNEVISRAKRDYGIKFSGWEYDAIEWIADGVERIGCFPSFEICAKDVTVCEFRARIPCGSESIIGVVRDDNARLSFNSGFAITDTDYIKFLKGGLTALSSLSCSREWYSLQPNWMRFSFEDGHVRVYRMGIPTNEQGFPCVPDVYEVKDALATYICLVLLQKGHTLPSLNYKDATMMWEKKYPQAQNALKMPSVEAAAEFKRNWVDLIPSISREYNFFMT